VVSLSVILKENDAILMALCLEKVFGGWAAAACFFIITIIKTARGQVMQLGWDLFWLDQPAPGHTQHVTPPEKESSSARAQCHLQNS
jgi:hypothetical protein